MTCRGARTLSRACLVAAFLGGISSVGSAASASVFHGGGWGGNTFGNGKHNRNVFVINSPSSSHDILHIRTVNVGGKTIAPGAVCKKPAGRCKITQRIIVDP